MEMTTSEFEALSREEQVKMIAQLMSERDAIKAEINRTQKEIGRLKKRLADFRKRKQKAI